MKLTRIELEDLRGIDRLAIDLALPTAAPRRRLILLGRNGAGKSTILHVLARILELATRRTALGAPVFGAGDVRLGQTAARVHCRFALDDAEVPRPGHDWPRAVALTFQLGGSENALGLSGFEGGWVTGSDDFSSDLAMSLAVRPASAPCVLIPADRPNLELNLDLALSVLASFSPHDLAASRSHDRYPRLAAMLALAFAGPVPFDRDGHLARMWKVLAKYVPTFPPPLRTDGLTLFFEVRGGAVPITALSDGERALLLLFAEIALRNPGHGLVLIDEPEQHLHPRWQKELLEGLQALAPDAQFIFATQAPYLAAAAPDDVVRIGDWGTQDE